MVNIAIVEDDKVVLSGIEKYICKIDDVSDELAVFGFQTAEEVLGAMEKGDEFDILFSDIALPGMNGIELGELVRRKYPGIYLIFITSYPEFAARSYTLNAYQYILKDDMYSRLPGIVKELVELVKKEKEKYRIIEGVESVVKLFYKDIIYIKKIKGSKYVEYYTVNGVLKERCALEQLINEINSEEFVLIERAYLINLHHVIGVKNNTICMENNLEVEVSSRKMYAVKKLLHEWWGKI